MLRKTSPEGGRSNCCKGLLIQKIEIEKNLMIGLLAKNSPQKWVPPSCIKMFSFFTWKYCCVLSLWCGDNPDENVKWLSKRQNLYHSSCYSYNCYSVECQDELTVTIWPQVFRILLGDPNYYRYIATHIFLGLHSNGKTVTTTDVVEREDFL